MPTKQDLERGDKESVEHYEEILNNKFHKVFPQGEVDGIAVYIAKNKKLNLTYQEKICIAANRSRNKDDKFVVNLSEHELGGDFVKCEEGYEL